MDITIKIDDESRFKDIIANELDALTKEELHSAILDAVKAYFSEPQHVMELFYKEEEDRWGGVKRQRSEFFERLIPDSSVHPEEIDILRKKFEKLLSDDKIVKQLIVDTWFANLCNNMGSSLGIYNLQNELTNVLTRIRQQ